MGFPAVKGLMVAFGGRRQSDRFADRDAVWLIPPKCCMAHGGEARVLHMQQHSMWQGPCKQLPEASSSSMSCMPEHPALALRRPLALRPAQTRSKHGPARRSCLPTAAISGCSDSMACCAPSVGCPCRSFAPALAALPSSSSPAWSSTPS